MRAVVSLYLNRDLVSALRQEAAKCSKSLGELVDEIVREALDGGDLDEGDDKAKAKGPSGAHVRLQDDHAA